MLFYTKMHLWVGFKTLCDLHSPFHPTHFLIALLILFIEARTYTKGLELLCFLKHAYFASPVTSDHCAVSPEYFQVNVPSGTIFFIRNLLLGTLQYCSSEMNKYNWCSLLSGIFFLFKRLSKLLQFDSAILKMTKSIANLEYFEHFVRVCSPEHRVT